MAKHRARHAAPKSRRAFRIGLMVSALLVVGAGIALATGDSYDLINNNTVTVNDGAIFEYFDTTESDGTGVLNPYLRVQDNDGDEAGYNSDYVVSGGGQFDQVSPNNAFTDSILLSEIPSIEVGTDNYREFIADFNEANSGVDAQISIDAFELYLFDQSTTAFDVELIGDPNNGGIDTSYPYGEEGFNHPSAPSPDAIWGTPDWYLDGHVLATEENSSGSGQGDLQILIPESEFDAYPECFYGSTTCDIYVVNHVALGFYGELYVTEPREELPPDITDPENWDVTSTFEEFAVRLYPILDVSKTLDITYEEKITWTLTKTVDDASHSGNAGEDAGSSIWTVVADKTVTNVNYQASGEILLSNDSGVDLEVTSVDDLFGVVPVDVTCPNPAPFVILDMASVTCGYSVDLDGAPTLPSTNEVEVAYYEVNRDGLQVGPTLNRFATASDDAAESRGTIGEDSGTLADPRFSYSQSISGDTTVTFDETFTCSSDASLYTDGSYSFTETNTATLNGNINLSASASVDVDCTLPVLTVAKTAAGTYDRTVTWEL
ncbi:MAG: hypothetical protein P1T08_18025, partial [Acidimicrobiia bacterium]|nr:hypothetical protein [Acidimicrobiia bacterium]